MFNLLKKTKITADINIYILWAIISFELLMSFSAFGYIHIEPISLTIVYIPVLLAGCLLGPKEAALVGCVFGLASMWKASAFYVEGGDVFFSPIRSGQPIQSILLSVGARTLFGFAAGLMYLAAKRSRHPLIGILIVSSVGRTLHSFFVYSFMGALFPESGLNVSNILDGIFKWDSILFLIFQDAIILLSYSIYSSDRTRKLAERIQTVNKIEAFSIQNKKTLFFIVILTFIAAISIAWYFIDRLGIVMSRYGIAMSENFSYDIFHLQMQFLFGIVSLFGMVILVVILYQKNFNYTYYEARLDDLTGLPGRGQFFLMGEKALEKMKFTHGGKTGFFIILDIDHFKHINDRYGHPTGDKILVNVAAALEKVLGMAGILGRLGGDEFVALITQPMTEDDIRKLLIDLQEKVHQIEVDDKNLTCSIGVVAIKNSSNIDELYHSADRMLYEAKINGRNQAAFK